MRNLIRKPLPWLVVSECAIVGALAVVAWHMIASPAAPQLSGFQPVAPTAQAREPVTSGTRAAHIKAKAPIKTLLPGLNLDTNFWRLRLAALNRGESSFEQLEWRIVRSAMDSIRHYVKSVIVPAIVRAERVGTG